MTSFATEFPPHVRRELYSQLSRLTKMALADTAQHNSEQVYYLELMIDLCEDRLKGLNCVL